MWQYVLTRSRSFTGSHAAIPIPSLPQQQPTSLVSLLSPVHDDKMDKVIQCTQKENVTTNMWGLLNLQSQILTVTAVAELWQNNQWGETLPRSTTLWPGWAEGIQPTTLWFADRLYSSRIQNRLLKKIKINRFFHRLVSFNRFYYTFCTYHFL